jgi:hypothetical protein
MIKASLVLASPVLGASLVLGTWFLELWTASGNSILLDALFADASGANKLSQSRTRGWGWDS